MHQPATVTVIGAGIAGLIAATELAEAGVPVHVLEARSSVGGRGRSTVEPWIANMGPRAVYRDGSLWNWVVTRGLADPVARPAFSAMRLRWDGRRRVRPPAALVRALPSLRSRAAVESAPVDVSLHDWIAARHGDEAARWVAGMAGVLTFDHDPGRLSAAFVAPRIHRILLSLPPLARYPIGGWSALIERMAAHARAAGAVIETGAKADLLPDGPVIVAVEPRAARALLPGARLEVTGTRTALLDVGLRREGRPGPSVVSDFDEGGFAERYTAWDPALAPADHELVQLMVGVRPAESLASAVGRLESLLDAGWPGWRGREVWRRRMVVNEASGALDLPGSTWRDRPAVDQGDGVWLAGDWVAAPGHLSEVSCASAVEAAQAAVTAVRGRTGPATNRLSTPNAPAPTEIGNEMRASARS